MYSDYFILCKALVWILKEDWGEDLRSWTHVISTLTIQIDWSTLIISLLIISLTVIALFSVVMYQTKITTSNNLGLTSQQMLERP